MPPKDMLSIINCLICYSSCYTIILITVDYSDSLCGFEN